LVCHRDEPTTVTPAPTGAGQKERIHLAAAELFAQNGYHATGVQQLADAVGLARGALYHHISSKEEVLEAIIGGVLEQLVSSGQSILASEIDAEAKLRLLARDLLRNLTERHAEWTVTIRESAALSPASYERVLALRDEYEGLWHRAYREGVAAGRFRPTHDVVMKGILGMFNHSFAWIDRTGRLSADEIADQYIDIVVHGIVVVGRPRPPRSTNVAGTGP
jgi:AcrR family transcriptional regulator